MGGEKLDLTNDAEILKIKAPANRVEGPYCVVYKDIVGRWAIVTVNWDKCPRLATRWFWGNSGSPSLGTNALWHFIPSELDEAILNSLPIPIPLKEKIRKFLLGEVVSW